MIGLLVGRVQEEDGHVGAALTSGLGVGAGAAIVVAFAANSDVAGIIGGVLTGAGIVAGVSAPHSWVRRIYPRLDKLDPEDPEARPDVKLRIEF